MARGNWKPNVIKPRTRCRLCGYVVKPAALVRMDGIYPAHKICADRAGRQYTEGATIDKKPV